MGDYSEMKMTDTKTCMILGDLLKEKTAELDAMQIADEVDTEAIHTKELEVNAIREVYKECGDETGANNADDGIAGVENKTQDCETSW